jgi:hypothetical protein
VDEQDVVHPAAMIDKHFGIEAHGVAIAELLTTACWNVQGNPAREPFAAAFSRRFGMMGLPVANTSARNQAWTALWLGPRSWLLVANPRLDAPIADAFIDTRDALNVHGGALFASASPSAAFTPPRCWPRVVPSICIRAHSTLGVARNLRWDTSTFCCTDPIRA